MTMIQRIQQMAERAFASPERALHSLAWYDYAGRFCADIDSNHGLESGTTAGFVAALSPLNSWDLQVKYTEPSIARCIALIDAGKRAHEGITGPGFFSNRDKAVRILCGEKPLDVLGGDKVRRFYRNLTGDYSVVTIDRHALAISGWQSKSALSGNPSTPLYQRIECAFKFAAENVGLAPAEIQALTWCYWREVKAGRAW